MVAPTTLREKYMREREYLYELLSKIDDAVMSLAGGSVASYSLGNRSCTYADIDKLKALRREAEDRINEIEASLRGASQRSVYTNVFLDPSTILPRRW